MNLLQSALPFVAASALLLLAFASALRHHFRRAGAAAPPRMRVVQTVFACCAAIGTFQVMTQGAPVGLYAWVVLASSAGLFSCALWSTRVQRPSVAFSDDVPCFLLRNGPYRFVRHPFYSSYMLYFAALACAAPAFATIACLLAVVAMYARIASLEEAKFARSRLRVLHARYVESVGMFLPRWPPPSVLGRFGPRSIEYPEHIRSRPASEASLNGNDHTASGADDRHEEIGASN